MVIGQQVIFVSLYEWFVWFVGGLHLLMCKRIGMIDWWVIFVDLYEWLLWLVVGYYLLTCISDWCNWSVDCICWPVRVIRGLVSGSYLLTYTSVWCHWLVGHMCSFVQVLGVIGWWVICVDLYKRLVSLVDGSYVLTCTSDWCHCLVGHMCWFVQVIGVIDWWWVICVDFCKWLVSLVDESCWLVQVIGVVGQWVIFVDPYIWLVWLVGRLHVVICTSDWCAASQLAVGVSKMINCWCGWTKTFCIVPSWQLLDWMGRDRLLKQN